MFKEEFCNTFIKDALPAEMTVGGRTYDILGFLQGEEELVRGTTMVGRVKEMNANLGQDDGQHLLDHQKDIPVVLRGKVVFVFTDWRHPGKPELVCCVFWDDDRWVQNWNWLDNDWNGNYRVLRRK